MKKYALPILLSLLMNDGHAIVPRNEGSDNAKHPLLKKLGANPAFRAHARQLQDTLNGVPNPEDIRRIRSQEARARMTLRASTDQNQHTSVFRDDENISITRPPRAPALHQTGYQGTGIKIAVIEKEFDVNALLDYGKKGLMDNQGLLLNNIPPKSLHTLAPDRLNSEDLRNQRLEKALQLAHAATAKDKDARHEEHQDLEALIRLKKIYDASRGKDSHGYPVLEACHRMAPKATLLPIDKEQLLGPDHRSVEKYIRAIQIAMDQGAHIITMSLSFPGWNTEDLRALGNVMEAARNKGIAIFMASGNESEANKVDYFDRRPKGAGKSEISYIGEQLDYKGFCPVGAVTYTRHPERPRISTFTSMPPRHTPFENIFLLAPGEKLYLGGRVINGTSFASPAAAGAFALLKEYALRHHIPFTDTHDLMQVLITSGTPVTDHGWGQYWQGPTYKQINLVKACDTLDRRMIQN